MGISIESKVLDYFGLWSLNLSLWALGSHGRFLSEGWHHPNYASSKVNITAAYRVVFSF